MTTTERAITATDAVIDALAVARIVRLLQVDEIPIGPWRERVLDRYGDQRWSALLECPWCLSVHVGAGVVVARHLFPRAWPWMARALASSAVAGHLAELG